MQNLKYARPSDIIGNVATITTDGDVDTDTDYGLASLVDGRVAKPCKFTEFGPVRITFDFATATRVDGLAIPHHNLDNGLVCTVAMNATDSWGAPTCSTTLTVGNANLDGHRSSPWVDLTAANGYSAGGFRYLSILIPSNTYRIKIGEILVLSRLREFSRWVQFGGQKGMRRRFLENLETEYGVVRVHRRRIKQRAYSFIIKGSDADYTALQDLGDDAGGRARPFFVTIDSDVKNDGGLYARFTEETAQLLEAVEEWFDDNPFRFEIEEESRSLPL